MLVVAPFVAVLLGYFVKPPLLAFFAAALGGAAIIATGTLYALDVAPSSGTGVGAMVFGSGAAILSLLMAALTSGTRALHRHQQREETLGEQPTH
jgi:hypothetical protein